MNKKMELTAKQTNIKSSKVNKRGFKINGVFNL